MVSVYILNIDVHLLNQASLVLHYNTIYDLVKKVQSSNIKL